tara:strand:- start:334 stop:657 length:324 start_codon:yes stop_codon:yes gene_type:complete
MRKFKKYFYGRKILIAKEISKIHETFYREEIDNIKSFEKQFKGELTIVVSEKGKKKQKDNLISIKIINKVKKYLKRYSIKDTVELISKTETINKKIIYNLCLKIKNE